MALLRRSRSDSYSSSESVLLHFGRYSLNVEGCLLRKGSMRIPLSGKEFDVLKYLVVNCGKALMTGAAINVKRLIRAMTTGVDMPTKTALACKT